VCDWNDDDSLDLIVGERLGYLTWFRRTGTGELTSEGRVQAGGIDIHTDNNSWPFVTDWNEDGRKDLLVGQEGIGDPSNVFLYLNEGTSSAPVFTDTTRVLRSGAPFRDYRCAPVTEDLDLDGRKDLVLGEWYSSVRWYENSGTNADPVLTTFINLVPPDPDSFLNGNPPRINFADWDGDIDRDMITCDYYGSVFLRRNITVVGVEEEPGSSVARPGLPTVMRAPDLAQLSGRVFDNSGRDVTDQRRSLSPGVYFIQRKWSSDQVTKWPSVRRLIVVE